MGNRRGGRPTKYTARLGEELCMRIALGESLRAVCRDERMPHLATVARWLMRGEPAEFCEQYTRARRMQAETFADDLHEIADDARGDYIETRDENGEVTGHRFCSEAVQRSRLRVDTRKWIAERLLPRKYGTRAEVEHSAGGGIYEFLQGISQAASSTPQGRIRQHAGYGPRSEGEGDQSAGHD